MAEIIHFSEVDDALAVVNAFDAEPSKTVRWKLDRAATLARLRDLLLDPTLLNQRGLNACGPAVFFRIMLERHPVAVANFACQLLRDGSSSIGSLTVTPGAALLAQDYASVRVRTNAAHPNFMPEPAEWMLLSALRDSENEFVDYLGEPSTIRDMLAGMTLPGTLVDWLTAANIYSTVEDHTSFIAGVERERLFTIIPDATNDTVLFINRRFVTALLPEPVGPAPRLTSISPSVPDHYVLMMNAVTVGSDPDWIPITVWTWGRDALGWQGRGPLFNDYFGLVHATV